MKYSTTYIYVLIDPRTEEIRYVGKTVNPYKRFYKHYSEHETNYKSRWIEQLRKLDLKPRMEIIEAVATENWQEREIYWIAELRAQGCRLTNVTTGGEGCNGYVASEEARRKISARTKGRKLTDEQRRKLGIASKGRIAGSKNPRAVLTTEIVLEIRQKYATGNFDQGDLADEYGISRMQIGKIVLGRVWKDAGGEIKPARDNTKITRDQAAEIRSLYATGEWSCKRLGQRFGLSSSMIHLIVTNRRHIE